jgi:SAM-dependent methyltransferase
MHAQSMQSMTEALQQIVQVLPPPGLVGDVGSQNINGDYRGVVTGLGYDYLGIDITAGPNVDVVMQSDLWLPFADQTFDIVISGQMLEHCRRPDVIVDEMGRVLKVGGFLVLNTHTSFPEHRFPKDYWRFMADGLEELLKRAKVLGEYQIRYIPYHHTDIQAIARRVQ